MMNKNSKYGIMMAIALFLSACAGKSENTVKRTTVSMGTTIEIQVRDEREDLAYEAINQAFDEFERINSKYSTYIEDSYLNRINDNDSAEITIDTETFWLLKKCDENFELTKGGFDPAVGNLVELLGFEDDNPDLPKDDDIKKKLDEVGWKHVKLLDGNRLRRERKVRLNLNAMVKGYAVDRAAKIISDNGIEKYLVNAGGEIKTAGFDWSIGIQHPRKGDSLVSQIKLRDLAVATSGDYQRFFTKNGRRFTHIINPLSGYPADGCQSVTVIAQDVLTADALATGLFVLGAENGMGIVDNLKNTEAMIIDSAGKVFVSSGFSQFIRKN